MKKVARKLLGVAVVGAFLLAFAGAVASPAQAEMICYTAPNGAPVCYDSGPPPEAPGTGGVGGGAGNNIALPPAMPPSAPKPVAPPVYNKPPAPAPMPAPVPAPAPRPVQQAPAPQIQAPAKNYAPSAPIGHAPAQNQADVPAPVQGSTTVEETNPGDVTPAEAASDPSVTPADASSIAPAEASPTVSASPSASAAPTSELVINPSVAGDSQPSPGSLAGFALAGGVIGSFAAFYIVRFFRTRKFAATSMSDTDS